MIHGPGSQIPLPIAAAAARRPGSGPLDRTIDRLTDLWVQTLASGRERSVIRSYVNRNRQDLRNSALGTEEERRAFRQDVIEAAKGALASLDLDCRDDPAGPALRHTCCPDDCDAHVPGERKTPRPKPWISLWCRTRTSCGSPGSGKRSAFTDTYPEQP
ncbi:hypothetical protein [Methanoculleus sp. MH98A]|uniref:hypothetical protein n=1 Tax=Methanoculleus sp. MH98A TaxID=1495314 RepID=UPI0012DC852E|nr:hypothetical protein [Methanoculleus sp. MH98A]